MIFIHQISHSTFLQSNNLSSQSQSFSHFSAASTATLSSTLSTTSSALNSQPINPSMIMSPSPMFQLPLNVPPPSIMSRPPPPLPWLARPPPPIINHTGLNRLPLRMPMDSPGASRYRSDNRESRSDNKVEGDSPGKIDKDKTLKDRRQMPYDKIQKDRTSSQNKADNENSLSSSTFSAYNHESELVPDSQSRNRFRQPVESDHFMGFDKRGGGRGGRFRGGPDIHISGI